MKLSIVIPYFNRSNTIQRCLDSIGRHLDIDTEIVVVDDCSYIEYIEHGYNEKIIRLPFNHGPVAARIVGAENSTGDWILFLDSDDELFQDWNSIANFLKNSSDYSIHGFTSNREKPSRDYYISSQDEYWGWVGDINRAGDYILFVRRDLIVNLSFPKLRMSEVWFINKLFIMGRGIYHQTPIFIYHQDSGNQLSKKRVITFLTTNFERISIKFVAFEFISLYHKLPNSFKKAWTKRLIKEAVLSLNFIALCRIAFKVIEE